MPTGFIQSFNRAELVVPADAVPLPSGVTRGLHANSAGMAALVFVGRTRDVVQAAGKSPVVVVYLQAGVDYPYEVAMVYATGTTVAAGALVALY